MWTNVSETATNWTGVASAAVSTIPTGAPIGLLLTLTYADTQTFSAGGILWTATSGTTTTWT